MRSVPDLPKPLADTLRSHQALYERAATHRLVVARADGLGVDVVGDVAVGTVGLQRHVAQSWTTRLVIGMARARAEVLMR